MIGFQEVFSIESLKELVGGQGYDYFAVVDTPEVIDDFIYKRPVVAIAAKYPIVEVAAVEHDNELASTIGLNSDFIFSRKVLRATITLPHIGNTDCYVVHFKSKRPMIEVGEHSKELSADPLQERSPEKNIIEILKANVAGGWGSTVQRGSEATLLMIEMIARREATQQPMVLMGDFNNDLADGVLSHLLTNTLRFAPAFDAKTYLAKYCLNDSWDLFVKSYLSADEATLNEAIKSEAATSETITGKSLAENVVSDEVILSDDESIIDTNCVNTKNINAPKAIPLRAPTHYYGASSSVLDYILLSSEFDASYLGSFFEVSDYKTYDRHLINPEYERDDLTTDHGVVLVTLTLRS